MTIQRGPAPQVDTRHDLRWIRTTGQRRGASQPNLLAFTDIDVQLHRSHTGRGNDAHHSFVITIRTPHIYVGSELTPNPGALARAQQHERGHDGPWVQGVHQTVETLRGSLDFDWNQREITRRSLSAVVAGDLRRYRGNLLADLTAAANRWDADDYPRIDADFARIGYTPASLSHIARRQFAHHRR